MIAVFQNLNKIQWRRGQSSPEVLSMDFSQTAISLPRLGALHINCLPAMGLPRLLLLLTLSISKPSASASQASPYRPSLLPPTSPRTHFKFSSFLPDPSALTTPPSPTPSQISDLHPAQNGFPSGLTKPSPLWPTLHPIPSVLASPLLPSPSCFAPLPTTSFGYCCPKSTFVPPSLSLSPFTPVRPTDDRPNLRCCVGRNKNKTSVT